ncbi:transporter [Amycolatopsis acidiphila]|uniref:Transporter n=1 Tax=Amycolatopsis acidiphila TaxID=715473 RepID=A0A558A254_9PSEU|nr:transporter [Amycolatopsis acidiphila]TVT18332.1 transporter [Amycolatopsis acidiphila]UIJ56724.1 transporter [Amycolatopsis acidiphila]GHG55526.1 transporter [Amycolatopsis acidiphila]
MERFVLVLVVLACFALAVWGMRVGWRRRARSQSVLVPPFPQVPEEPGEPLLEAPGLYVSTTTAGNWQDRIVTRGVGLRGRAVLRRYAGGVEVDRAGAPGFWIPNEAVAGIRRGSAIAGKVMGSDSLLIITWRAGEVELDTGFRGDDHGSYPDWIESLGSEIKGGAQ